MKILIISPENILPANSGGRLRTLNLVKELSKFHTISLAYIETDKHQIDPQLQQFCESILPMYAKQGRVDMTLATKVWVSLKSALTRSFPDVDYYNSAINKDSLRKFIKDHSFDMVITEFSYLLPIASEIKKEFPHLKVILDAHNVESHLQRRLGQSSNNLAITIQKKLLWRNLQRIERDFGRKMDGILIILLPG